MGFRSAWAFPVDEVALIVGFSGDLAGSPPRNDRRRGLTGKMGPWIGSA
jgi:3-methyladenine DNA glycosylase/8-oxoguanine DNA glycosylase